MQLDITVATPDHQGLQRAETQRIMLHDHPLARGAILACKYLLERHNLADPYTGGLSSYATALLVVYFIQLMSRRRPVTSVADCLLGVLDYYGYSFDVQRHVVALHGPWATSPSRNPTDELHPTAEGVLFVRDPLGGSQNVGGCFNFGAVQALFRDMLAAPGDILPLE